MKRVLFFSLILSCLFSFGKCHKKKHLKKQTANSEVWMQYNETKCSNPWQFNWLIKPTREQILNAVKSDLLGKEIAVLEIRSSTKKDFISCDACDCPNGTSFYVRVNKSEIKKLKVLKFFETKEVPNAAIIDNTK